MDFIFNNRSLKRSISSNSTIQQQQIEDTLAQSGVKNGDALMNSSYYSKRLKPSNNTSSLERWGQPHLYDEFHQESFNDYYYNNNHNYSSFRNTVNGSSSPGGQSSSGMLQQLQQHLYHPYPYPQQYQQFLSQQSENPQRKPPVEYFNYLSVELIIKIFNYCDLFITPLLFICKDWYFIIMENQSVLWRELKISVNSNTKPISFSPSKSAILSYFNSGFYKSLKSFSINSIDFKPINQNNQNNQNNRNKRQQYLSNNNNNSESNNEIINNFMNIENNNNSFTKDYKFLKEIIAILCNNQNRNLKHIDIILPINYKQLSSIMNQCKNLKSLSFNSLLVNDEEFKDVFDGKKESKGSLKHLSVMVLGQYSQSDESFKKKWNLSSSITPASLYSISALLGLKSLKFSLLPHYGNYKSIPADNLIQQPLTELNESDRYTSALGSLKELETLEISSCTLSGSVLSDLLIQGCFENITNLVLYRINSLTALKFSSHSLHNVQLSCLSYLEYIELTCGALDSFSIEGCESLQSTLLYAPQMQTLSFESCSGRLNLLNAHSLQCLSLFECVDLTQRALESLLDSLPALEELYIYLHQIKNLRLASVTLRKLDLEAWSGILSCVLDCPSLEELVASESTIETLYLKATNVNNIELDFCDSLRTIIIDILSCNHFSFTQNHPFKGLLNLPDLTQPIGTSSGSSRKMRIDNQERFTDDDDESEDESEEEIENRINRTYFLSTNLFLQSQNYIQNCIILSCNIIGNLSSRVIGSLSIEERSQNTFIYNVQKICKYSIYKEISNNSAKSPKFVPIFQQFLNNNSFNSNNYNFNNQNNYYIKNNSMKQQSFISNSNNNNNNNNIYCNNQNSYYSRKSNVKLPFNVHNYSRSLRDNTDFEYLDEHGGNSNSLFNGFKK